jgi:hypothetical protein
MSGRPGGEGSGVEKIKVPKGSERPQKRALEATEPENKIAKRFMTAFAGAGIGLAAHIIVPSLGPAMLAAASSLTSMVSESGIVDSVTSFIGEAKDSIAGGRTSNALGPV